jgi:hypothetical protein
MADIILNLFVLILRQLFLRNAFETVLWEAGPIELDCYSKMAVILCGFAFRLTGQKSTFRRQKNGPGRRV